MTRKFVHNRRRFLIALAITLSAIDAFIVFHSRNVEKNEFEISLITFRNSMDVKNGELPAYDAVNRRWLLGGKPLTSLGPFLRRPDSDAGVPGIFALVSLPRGTNMVNFREALLSLKAQRICGIAVKGDFFGSEVITKEGFWAFQINWVRSDTGSRQICSDEFSMFHGRKFPIPALH